MSLPKEARSHGLNGTQQASAVRGEPAVQLVIHHSTDSIGFFNKRPPKTGKIRLEAEDCVKEVERLLGEGAPLANTLRNELRQQHFGRVHAPIVSGQACNISNEG
jgi:hypothetical protein